jgi:hypothetical protein
MIIVSLSKLVENIFKMCEQLTRTGPVYDEISKQAAKCNTGVRVAGDATGTGGTPDIKIV